MKYAIGETERCRRLQGDDYDLIQNDEELYHVLDYVPQKKQIELFQFSGDRITGAIIKLGDGEYEEIWLTTDNCYFSVNAEYTRVA